MTPRRKFLLASLAALAALGLFSLVFSLLAERGLWPELAPGALHDTDLVAGFLSAIALAALLAWRRGGKAASVPRVPPPDGVRLEEESRPDPVG